MSIQNKFKKTDPKAERAKIEAANSKKAYTSSFNIPVFSIGLEKGSVGAVKHYFRILPPVGDSDNWNVKANLIKLYGENKVWDGELVIKSDRFDEVHLQVPEVVRVAKLANPTSKVSKHGKEYAVLAEEALHLEPKKRILFQIIPVSTVFKDESGTTQTIIHECKVNLLNLPSTPYVGGKAQVGSNLLDLMEDTDSDGNAIFRDLVDVEAGNLMCIKTTPNGQFQDYEVTVDKAFPLIKLKDGSDEYEGVTTAIEVALNDAKDLEDAVKWATLPQYAAMLNESLPDQYLEAFTKDKALSPLVEHLNVEEED